MSGSIRATWPKRQFHGTLGSSEERREACAEYSECPRRPEPEIELDVVVVTGFRELHSRRADGSGRTRGYNQITHRPGNERFIAWPRHLPNGHPSKCIR